MDIDGSSMPNPQNVGEIDQNLLLQFSCMNTTDREELIGQMQRLLGPSLTHNTASFFLDMSNWKQLFEQNWNIANTGTEAWPGSCRLIQAGGEHLGAIPIYVPPLPPGHSTTVMLKLIAPSKPGTHRGYFHLISTYYDELQYKTNTLWVEITVESEMTMALVEQLAALPVPSSRAEDNTTPNVSQMPPQDDQMC
ncbi:hypothetical protein MSG28_001745 [Choristoneura fumiferana]|uniref:Uncharacterized protein n=1 Tax=Choristoneura fumiferana TaxID=7141 RepID=A0ACC0KWJ2_CHOFU|nr:hypothetical protein MSG28_001745 [Choristoneura fumiferana]